MSKKFLSVTLLASMIFSSMGGHYCFAENKDLILNCHKELEECNSKKDQIRKNLLSLMPTCEVNKIEKKVNDHYFKPKTNDIVTQCFNELRKCKYQNVEYEMELAKYSNSSSTSNYFSDLRSTVSTIINYICYVITGLFFTAFFIN